MPCASAKNSRMSSERAPCRPSRQTTAGSCARGADCGCARWTRYCIRKLRAVKRRLSLDGSCSVNYDSPIHCGQALDMNLHEALFSCAPWGGNTPSPGRTERSRKGPFLRSEVRSLRGERVMPMKSGRRKSDRPQECPLCEPIPTRDGGPVGASCLECDKTSHAANRSPRNGAWGCRSRRILSLEKVTDEPVTLGIPLSKPMEN